MSCFPDSLVLIMNEGMLIGAPAKLEFSCQVLCALTGTYTMDWLTADAVMADWLIWGLMPELTVIFFPHVLNSFFAYSCGQRFC